MKMKIEVLGPGCPRCQATEKNAKKAIEELGLDAKLTKVTDVVEISKRKVLSTPALLVDGEIKVSGKIPTVEEVKKILQE